MKIDIKNNIISYYKIAFCCCEMTGSSYNLRNRNTKTNQKSHVYVANGQLVSLNVEGPNQKETPIPVSPSMPPLIPASCVRINNGVSSLPCFDDVCEPRTIFNNHKIVSSETPKNVMSNAAHNEEQTMLWQNIAKLFVKCEDADSNIVGIRSEYNPCINHLYTFTDEIYGELQKYKTSLSACQSELAETKKNMKKRFKSTKKLVTRKFEKCRRGAASAAFNADMEVFNYIETFKQKIDDLHETIERQNDKIEELTSLCNSNNNHYDDDDAENDAENDAEFESSRDIEIRELKHKMKKMQEEISDLNDLYDDDYHRFCRREDELKDHISAVHDEASSVHTFAISAKQNSDERIDAAIKAIETWGSDIYRIEQEMKNMQREIRADMDTEQQASEYWIERELKSFETEKQRINIEIQGVRSYIDTVVAGDLREEFARAISREVEFESKVTAELVKGLNNELVNMITRSNEIHTERHFHVLAELQKTKEDTTSMCQALKNSIGYVDCEVGEVKETIGFVKEDIASLTLEIEDQKQSIRGDIYADMDADYYDLKKYICNKFKKHMKHDHDAEVKGSEEAQVKNETESVIVGGSEAVSEQENSQVLGEDSKEVVLAESNDANGNGNKFENDIVIIMDDASYHTSDEE